MSHADLIAELRADTILVAVGAGAYAERTRDLSARAADALDELTRELDEAHADRNVQLEAKYTLTVERDRLRVALRQIGDAGEIHDPFWAGAIARAALFEELGR